MVKLRTIDYDEFVAQKKAQFFCLPAKLGRRRLPRRRPRNIEERENLMRVDKGRFESRIAGGDLTIVSPRYIHMKLFQ